MTLSFANLSEVEESFAVPQLPYRRCEEDEDWCNKDALIFLLFFTQSGGWILDCMWQMNLCHADRYQG